MVGSLRYEVRERRGGWVNNCALDLGEKSAGEGIQERGFACMWLKKMEQEYAKLGKLIQSHVCGPLSESSA